MHTTTAYQELQTFLERPGLRFRLAGVAQLQAGAWRERPCVSLPDCLARLAVEPCAYLSKHFDPTTTAFPTNAAAPDHKTFDRLATAGGGSAYCGALWIEALEAALAMAQRLQLELGLDTGDVATGSSAVGWAIAGANFMPCSGTGSTTGSMPRGTPVVMADQLLWWIFYARLLGLPAGGGRGALPVPRSSPFASLL